MPYARNDGVAIHYRTEGEGVPLVLQHGSSQSLEDWAEFGYAQELRQRGRDHPGAFFASSEVLPHVKEFLATITATG